jgi:hybrid cluster-associated redox disulfide protein
MKITSQTTIFQAIHSYPETAEIFKSYGMPCSNCLAMMDETIEAGARRHGADLQKLRVFDSLIMNSSTKSLIDRAFFIEIMSILSHFVLRNIA